VGHRLNAKPSHTAAVWSIYNLATRRPHAVPNYLPVVTEMTYYVSSGTLNSTNSTQLNYSPVLTAAVCYVLTEKATVITTNLQASVRTQTHAVNTSSDGDVTVGVTRWRKEKNQVKRKQTAKTNSTNRSIV